MFEIYKARTLLLAQRFRWRITGANGEKVAASGEGFYSHANAVENALLTRRMLNEAYVNGDITGTIERRG